ncbi:MAG TPA: hypothetical protein VK149_04230 [Sideroxyarcus sp.]|nr:hypothetical protein [Sideroxyarcus sp.]
MARVTGGVQWVLPDKNGNLRKRPFMYTTVATADWMRALAEDGARFVDVEALSPFEPDAVAIAQAWIDAGYGDELLSDWIR